MLPAHLGGHSRGESCHFGGHLTGRANLQQAQTANGGNKRCKADGPQYLAVRLAVREETPDSGRSCYIPSIKEYYT